MFGMRAEMYNTNKIYLHVVTTMRSNVHFRFMSYFVSASENVN